MSSWNAVFRQGLIAGTWGGVTSAIALVLCGKKETGKPLAPVNAVSHWYWGDASFHRNTADASHTLAGYLTHHAAAIFWATAYAALARKHPGTRTLPGIAAGAVATSAVACLVDYQLTPARLKPGYEKELSRTALLGVYAALALGLAGGALAARERYQRSAGARQHAPRRHIRRQAPASARQSDPA